MTDASFVEIGADSHSNVLCSEEYVYLSIVPLTWDMRVFTIPISHMAERLWELVTFQRLPSC